MKKIGIKNIKSYLENSMWGEVFGSDAEGKARRMIVMSGVMSTVFNAFITGTFYTGFLLAMGIDIVNIGIISTITLITGFFNVFSPMFLNRFKQRKKVLLITRFIYHVVNILGVTFLPFVPLSVDGKITLLCVYVFISGTIANVTSPGFSAWHIGYMGDNNLRTKYLSLQMIINGAVSALTVLIFGQVATFVTSLGTEQEITFIVILRLCGFVLAMFELYFLTRPKEPEYHSTGSGTSFIAIFREPFRYKTFLATVIIVFVWNFANYISSSAFSTYVLDTLKISYGEITLIDSLYSLFLFALVPFWRKYTAQHSMFQVLLITMFCYGATFFFPVFFTQENAAFLFPFMRIIQHIFGTGLNLAFANIAWIHMPVKDRTTCLAFYTLLSNIFALIGQVTGTSIVAAAEDMTFSFLLFNMDSVQLLMFIQTALVMLIVIYIAVMKKKLEQPGDEQITE